MNRRNKVIYRPAPAYGFPRPLHPAVTGSYGHIFTSNQKRCRSCSSDCETRKRKSKRRTWHSPRQGRGIHQTEVLTVLLQVAVSRYDHINGDAPGRSNVDRSSGLYAGSAYHQAQQPGRPCMALARTSANVIHRSCYGCTMHPKRVPGLAFCAGIDHIPRDDPADRQPVSLAPSTRLTSCP